MAATLAPAAYGASDDTLRAALRRLRNGSLAWHLVAAELADREQVADERRAEQAVERYFEDRGAYYAGSEEEARDAARDSDFPPPPAW
jgi:hypothetical protein